MIRFRVSQKTDGGKFLCPSGTGNCILLYYVRISKDSNAAMYSSKILIRLVLGLSVVLHSSSVSAQWIGQVSNTSNNLQDVHFVNNSTGFICGSFGTVLRTDNGSNWIDDTIGTAGLMAVWAVDPDTVYTARSSLYKSIDGGISWIDIGGFGSTIWSIFDIEFITARTGCIIKKSNIYRTDDYGNSWVSVLAATSIKELRFLDDSVGFAFGGGSNPPLFWGELFRTTDGGITWDSLYSSSPDFNITAASFVHMDTGYVFMTPETILYTDNGGSTWTDVSSPIQMGPVYDCAFLNSRYGYAITSTGVIYKTLDGVNWNFEYSVPNTVLSSIDIIDSTAYVVGNDGTILKNEGLVTGWEEIDKVGSLILSPNPTSGLVSMSDLPSGARHFIVLNVIGEIVLKGVFPDIEDQKIDLGSLPSGIFHLRVWNSSGQVRSGKIVKI